MDDQTNDIVKWIKADQESAEIEQPRINRAQREVFSLLRNLTRNWKAAVDMAEAPPERKQAVMMLVWSGAVESRFGISIYSDAPPLRVQAMATGQWNPPGILAEVQRHLARFLKGSTSLQTDVRWELRLLAEGERMQSDLSKDTTKEWVVWGFVLSHRAKPRIRLRLTEAPAGQSGMAVAAAQAVSNVSVGDTVVNVQIDPARLVQAAQEMARASASAQTSAPQSAAGNTEPRPETAPVGQPMAEIEAQVKKVAPTDCSILILGETGTGKEYLARAIHKASARRRHPFAAINCATLPKERIDSELFGHVKGAFTGATENYPGQIRRAEGGTVFLDEIGELPPDCWGNLLRFLQEKEIHPMGGQTQTVDVRILAATNKPERVPADVLHRFDHRLHLPPLRARREAVSELAGRLFDSVKAKGKRSSLRFTQAEREKLAGAGYSWPGNVRQLEKAIQRAILLHDAGRELSADEVLNAAKAILSPA